MSTLQNNIIRQGLTAAEVAASREAHGRNVLTPRKRVPWWRKLAAKFADPLIVILLVAAVLSIGISFYEYFGLDAGATAFFEPVGIVVAIALATGLAFWFEQKADREFTLLNQQNDHEPVRVIRDGRETSVPRADIVVGDIVLLSTGDEIPADGKLIEATQMQVDESSLTGEPLCHKSIRPDEQDSEATYPTNHVLRGTKLLEGHGIMQVTAVGDKTENGRVFTETQIDSSVRTPLNEQLDRLGLLISRASYAVAALVIIGRIIMWFVSNSQLGSAASMSVSDPEISSILNLQSSFLNLNFLAYLLQSLMLAVTLIVVAVPEGLPMAVTLSLAYSMRRMLKTNNLVRRLHACETMGAATVICTDKTGTLTQNRMQVVEVHQPSTSSSRLLSRDYIAMNIAVNSTAALDGDAVLGNPTEGALLLWLRDQGIDYTDLRAKATIVEETPFTTERKYMATRITGADGLSRDTLLYIKGAPEVVLEMCCPDSYPSLQEGEYLDLREGDIAPATPLPNGRGLGEGLLLTWQQRGLRTLALAHACNDERPMLDALVAIADPVRADVPPAVKECLAAGIDVKIVTGDNMLTATEIARQIGLPARCVVTGTEVAAMSDEELRQRARDIAIVARARPMDKKRIVEALQACGEVVAVTGDGTNDAPALKAAHVGLSMGDGTAVAKEASDITIIDNSFASIGRAVMWGRSLYRNIQRFILFQLTVNVCACLTVLAGAFMGTDAPLTVTQMLWVNLIMDTFAAMALASLPPTPAVMHERPRDRRKFIISTPMWHFILGVGITFFLLTTALLWLFEHAEVTDLRSLVSLFGNGPRTWDHDALSPLELSLFFTTFVMLQFWNLFNARAFLTGRSAFDLRHCREFLFIVAFIFVGQIAIVQFGGHMFNVVPLTLSQWLTIIIATSPVLIIGEAVRAAKRCWKNC